MPTTRSKNLFYRCLLPSAPRVSGNPILSSEGRPLEYSGHFIRLIRRHHISGGAFLFCSSSGESRLYTKAFHTDLKPSSGTFFRVASVTKMATALVALHLQSQGLLDLSAPVSSILPEADGISELRGVTGLHLLSHTSGLADPPNLESLLLRGEPYPVAVSDCRVGEPGASFRYSNLGFGLLGCIFESVLNLPLRKIYHDYLFSPLSMNATLEGCTLSPDRIMPVVRVLPYRRNHLLTVTALGKKPLKDPDPLTHYGHTAGSMYTDLSSLFRLLCVVRENGAPLFSPTLSMKTPVASYGALSPTLSYGLGLLIIRDPRLSNGPVYGHQGFAYGCVDGAFWEESTGNMMISVNGGCSEARTGRLGLANFDLCRFAFRKELPAWT